MDTKDEVMKTISNMPNKTSVGFDGISNKLLKTIAPYIIDDLTACINKSFMESKFPDKIKVAKIIPIYKKGQKEDPANHRPIAQLSPFSKTFELQFLDQLTEFFDENNVINNNLDSGLNITPHMHYCSQLNILKQH